MANTLTSLLPNIYESLDVVSRELVGFIPNVFRNSSAEQAALNQPIMYPVTPSATAVDITPGVTSPDAGDQVIGNGTMTITKSKGVPVRWNGEQQRGALNTGWYNQVLNQQFQQAFRTLTNLMEVDLAALSTFASRAYGTLGTIPFATAGDLSDLAQMRKILEDNGTSTSALKMVLGSTAAASLRGKQSLLLKVNESGSDGLLRRGRINELPIEGFDLGVSNQIRTTVAGTGINFVTSGATAQGATSIVLVTGTLVVKPGDIVTFAGDTNKYVVTVGTTGPGTIQIAAPGVVPAAGITTGTAMTIGAAAVCNMAFDQMALHLVTRAPAMPLDPSGKPLDAATDVEFVTDPFTGLTFQIAVYPQFQQLLYMVSIAWGCGNVKPEHTALLIH